MRITIFRQFKVYYTIDYLLHVALCSWFVNRCMVRVFFLWQFIPTNNSGYIMPEKFISKASGIYKISYSFWIEFHGRDL